MPSADQRIDLYRTAAQAAVTDEVVLAVSVLGTESGSARGGSPRRAGGHLSPRLPATVLMAVTPSRLIALGMRRSGRVCAKRIVAIWPRRSVWIEISHDAERRQRLDFSLPDGSLVRLREQLAGDDFYTELGLLASA